MEVFLALGVTKVSRDFEKLSYQGFCLIEIRSIEVVGYCIRFEM